MQLISLVLLLLLDFGVTLFFMWLIMMVLALLGITVAMYVTNPVFFIFLVWIVIKLIKLVLP